MFTQISQTATTLARLVFIGGEHNPLRYHDFAHVVHAGGLTQLSPR